MMKIIIISSIIIILVSVFVAMQILTVTIKQDFDYFFLVQHWPGTVPVKDGEEQCFSKPTTTTTQEKVVEDFKIHGLWPQLNDGTHPENCDDPLPEKDKTPYNASLIKDMIPLLQTQWPSMKSPSGDGAKLWAGQWKKHGTCSKYTLDQHAYFKAALYVKAKNSLLQILKDKKIIADGNSYSLGSIMEALTDEIGFVPGLECTKDKSNALNLYQVKICVDKLGSNFIDCPVHPESKTCTDPKAKTKLIKFPKFPSSSFEGMDDALIEIIN